MSAVIDFPATAEATVDETPAQRRVRLGSAALSWLFAVLFAAAALLAATAIGVALLYRGDLVKAAPEAFYVGGGPPGAVIFADLPLLHRSAYGLVALVRLTPVVMVFWTLHRLFGGYARREIFSSRAARRFGALGAWLCAYALAPLAGHLFLSSTGYEIDRNWMHLASVQALVVGALVLVIGQVMQVGREIEEDRKGFV